MAEVILSICIPTYYRAKILKDTIKHLIQLENDEVEFLINDNGSPDETQEVVKEFKDSRIQYYRNDKNLGVDANLIKCVEHARGKFIFFLSDEDRIEFETIPWIIEQIKSNPQVTQIYGKVKDKRQGKDQVYTNPGNHYFKAGNESLKNLFFYTFYFSGLTFKRETINLLQAKKYIGYNYIHQVFLAQTLMIGDSICTSKPFCYIARSAIKAKSHIPSTKSVYIRGGLPNNHPFNRIPLVEQTIRIITDIMFKYPAAENVLIKKQMRLAGIYFAEIFERYPNLFFIFLMKFFKRNRRIRGFKLLFIFLRAFFYNIGVKITSKIKI